MPACADSHAPRARRFKPTQKLELQRAAIDCLSTVILRAGPEMTGMLVAHRVPAVLCSYIRRQCCSPTAPPDAAGGAGGRASSAVPAACSRRLFVLAGAAARALAQLVHPTGLQWRPLRPMPFGEAAAAAAANRHQRRQRRRRGVSSPPSVSMTGPSTAPGIVVDVNAAVELATSVWRQTAKHLLESAEGGGNAGCGGNINGGGGGDSEHGALLAAAEEEEASGINAVAALCVVLCAGEKKNASCSDDAADSSAGGSERGITAAAAAPFCGQSQSRRPFENGGGPDATRLAALRVLLHACRASPGVAHAIAAFDGGAAVRALLGQASPPPGAGPNVSTCISYACIVCD